MPSRKASRPSDGRLKKNRPPERQAMVRVKSRWQQLIDGEITVDDLDDDEIMAGRVKNKNGEFSGRPPKMMPREIIDGLRMEFHRRVDRKFEDGLQTALDTLEDVMTSRMAAAPARVRAAEVWIERVRGKVPDNVIASITVSKFEEGIESLLVDTEEDEGVHVITTLDKKRRERDAAS